MPDQPLVSVVIPCYNHERYIASCVESVLRQTHDNIQLIAIDDGSSDKSPQVLENLCDLHGFHYERQDNQGLASTLNRGLDLAKGQYFCALGSDDMMLPDKTQKQLSYMQENPQVDICGGNHLVIDCNGLIIDKNQRFPPARQLHFDDVFLSRKPSIAASTMMVRTDLIRAVGGYDPSIPLEDVYMWLKLTAKGHAIAALNDVLIYYRKHAENTRKNLSYMLANLERTYADYSDHPDYQAVMGKVYSSYFLTAAKKDKQLALKILRKLPLSACGMKTVRGILHLMKP